MNYKLNSFTSSITFMKIPFNYDDNYIIDGNKSQIEAYFSNRGGVEINNIQPPKLEKEIKYIIQLPNELVNEFTNIIPNDYFINDNNKTKLFNYCKFYLNFNYYDSTLELSNQNSGYVFYFIKGIKWKSTQTIELSLQMDILNTLNYLNAYNSDNTTGAKRFFTYGDKSNITRSHFNRLQTYNSNKYFKIDKLSEGIKAPLYHKTNTIIESDSENFYLIYKNSLDDSSDTNNVVDCYLSYGKIGNPQNKNVLVGGTVRRFTPQNIGNLYIYLLGPFSFSIYDEITQELKNINITNTNAYCEIFSIGGVLRIRTDLLGYDTNPTYYVSSYMEFTSDRLYYYSSSMIAHPPSRSSIEALPNTTLTPTASYSIWNDINKLNRTDSKLIKVIKLPYAPTDDIKYVSGNYQYNGDIWIYDETTKMLKLKDLNTIFKKELTTEWRDTRFTQLTLASKSPTATRNKDNEPKLYHSDYRYAKINYDSFSLIIYNELLNGGALTGTTPKIDFYTTTTINSRFIFQFKNNIYDISYSDYSNTLSVARNNELGLYNSSYINYIRNGFNYDVKNKNRNVAVNYGLGALQIVGAVGSAISSVYTGGVGIAGAVGLATGAVATFTRAINNQISQESSIAQKLDTLKEQANEVNSCDDVDLLDVYNGNKLISMKYQISDEMENLLFKLFFYTGYKCNIIGNIEYYIHSRYYFNFIQAELHLINVNKLIPNDLIEEFKNKFKEGVSFFHNRSLISSNSLDKGYNIIQDLENWETELVDET